MSARVVGVGDADVDIYLDVDHLPGRDEKELARRVELHPGGMVANFLVALARLGTPCAFHGPVGEDEYGLLALAHLRQNGVDTTWALVKPGERTHFCVVMLDNSGEKALIVAPTACLFPRPGDVSEDCLRSASHLHTTGADPETAARAIRLAKTHGASVSIDVEPSAAAQFARLEPLLADVDIAFVNQRAVHLLGGSDSSEQCARHLVNRGVGIACITMGERGAFVANRSSAFHTPAFPVKVVDSTGAGDCFAAGFVHAYLQRWPLARAATLASAMGAWCVGQRGGSSHTPTWQEVTEFIEKRQITNSK